MSALCRMTAPTLSTCYGSSLCCSTVVRSRPTHTKRILIPVCCLPSLSGWSSPNSQVTMTKIKMLETIKKQLQLVVYNHFSHLMAFVSSVLAEQVWDPLSRSETCRLVGFMQRLIKGYPTVLHGENRNTQVRASSQFCFIHNIIIDLAANKTRFIFISIWRLRLLGWLQSS